MFLSEIFCKSVCNDFFLFSCIFWWWWLLSSLILSACLHQTVTCNRPTAWRVPKDPIFGVPTVGRSVASPDCGREGHHHLIYRLLNVDRCTANFTGNRCQEKEPDIITKPDSGPSMYCVVVVVISCTIARLSGNECNAYSHWLDVAVPLINPLIC